MDRFRPGLEMLETRWVPAVTHTTVDLDNDGDMDDIQIVGDLKNSKVTIVDNPALGKVTLSIDATSNNSFLQVAQGDLAPTDFAYTNGNIVFSIFLAAGNDIVEYSVAGPDLTNQSRAFLLNLGGGADTFTMDLSAVPISGSHLALDVVGGSGADLVTWKFAAISDAFLSIHAALGGGGDRPTLSFQGAISDSTVQAEIDAGPGFNTVVLDVGAVDASEIALDVIGGNQALTVDTATVNLNGAVTNAARLDVRLDMLAGNDKVTANLKGGSFSLDSDARAVLLAKGGAGNDTMTINRAGAGSLAINATGLLSLDLRGGSGNDKITVALHDNVGALALAGDLQLGVVAGGGNDTLDVQISSTGSGNYNIALYGGYGDDKFTYDLEVVSGTPTFLPSGFALLDGGTGGNMLTHKFADISTPFIARFLKEKKGGGPPP